MAAEQGNAAAQSNLGFMYDNGRGVPQSDTEAVFWYRKAAEQGYVFAQSNLGFMCSNGRGTPQNDTEAVKWEGISCYAILPRPKDCSTMHTWHLIVQHAIAHIIFNANF